jgi:hypothetical protein
MLHATRVATVAVLASATPGCALSAGGGVARSTGRSSAAICSPSIEAQLQLPPGYRIVSGIEWTRAEIDTGSWRIGAHAGYSATPQDRDRIGWEATARMGFSRVRRQAALDSGAFAGARVAALLRVGNASDAWQGDRLVELIPFLVVDAGVNEFLAPGQAASTELSARVLLRIHFTSTLVP